MSLSFLSRTLDHFLLSPISYTQAWMIPFVHFDIFYTLMFCTLEQFLTIRVVYFVDIYTQFITFGHMFSRLKECQFPTLLTVLYVQLDHFVFLDLPCYLSSGTSHTQPKNPTSFVYNEHKILYFFRTAIKK